MLVEGYFDFAQVFQSQAAPAVASCGTALTPQQAQLLRRFTSKVILSFDPDAAGHGAAVAQSARCSSPKGSTSTSSCWTKAKIRIRSFGRNGPDQYREAAARRRGRIWSTCSIRRREGIDFAHDDSRREFLGKMLTVAARIPDAAARDQFADRIAHKARITEEVVRAEIRKAAVGRQTTVTTRRAARRSDS